MGKRIMVAVLVALFGSSCHVSSPHPRVSGSETPRSTLSLSPIPQSPCSGVTVAPREDIAKAAQLAPAGATLCIAGVHDVSTTIVPRADQHFVGMPGAVLDGGRRNARAFANYDNVDNVSISGLEIRNFAGTHGGEDGTVGAFTGKSWVIENNHIHDNAASGVSVGQSTGDVVRNNLIDHNGCGGVMGAQAVDPLIEGNEIAFNDYQGAFNPAWSCGGGKLNATIGLRFIQNYSHDNGGRGYWLDGNNTDALIQGSRFEDNSFGGLMLEINDPNHAGKDFNFAGAGIQVIGNSFTGNGLGSRNRVMYGPAIEVSATNGVEIAHNTIAPDNAHGITFTQTARGARVPGEDLTVHDIEVHDNLIGLRGSGTGQFTDIGRVGFYGETPDPPPPTRMTFSHNQYFFDNMSDPHFSLPREANQSDPWRFATWGQWQQAGYDTDSTVEPLSAFPERTTPQSPQPAS